MSAPAGIWNQPKPLADRIASAFRSADEAEAVALAAEARFPGMTRKQIEDEAGPGCNMAAKAAVARRGEADWAAEFAINLSMEA